MKNDTAAATALRTFEKLGPNAKYQVLKHLGKMIEKEALEQRHQESQGGQTPADFPGIRAFTESLIQHMGKDKEGM